MERLTLLKNQLAPKPEVGYDSEDAKKLLQKYRSKSTVCPVALRKAVFGQYVEFRQRVFDVLLSDPVFKQYTVTESSRKEIRGTSFQWIKTFFENFGSVDSKQFKENPGIYSLITNFLYEFDASLSVKLGVHFNLYGKTIANLGTEKHQPYIDRMCVLDDIGCFGLTELRGGSNVRGVLTRADFDLKTREFIISTPVDVAMKFWIGAAAQLANMSVIMAQLYIGDKNYGVHGFIVPIRDKQNHTLLPGVIVGDCGLKVGLNAIDNGFLIFKNVRVPYDNLLDKFSQITPEGKFKSPIKSADKRFGLSLGSLSGGRIQLIDCTNSNLRNALTVAIRYSACRRQFGPPGQAETNILEYPLTQYRLMPYLAECIAISMANYKLVEDWNNNQDKIFSENNPMLAEIHNLTSAMKPISSWQSQKGVQECREACGGLGYSAYNRLGQLREDNDINATWEGDNNVLLQQTSKFLMDSLRNLKGDNKLPFDSLQFLKADFNTNELFGLVDGKSAFNRDQFDIKKAFEVRANYLIHSSFEYLSKNMMSSDDAWQAWNNSHVFYLRDAAIAYANVYILQEFERRAMTTEDEKTRNALLKLVQLYGFNKIEQNIATYLEMGYFVKDDLTFVRERVKELCKEVKDEAIGMIDALAVPDAVLNSAIGSSDGDVYNRFITAIWTAPGTFEKAPYWKQIKKMQNQN